MKGITNYQPRGFERRAFQKTDALARRIKTSYKKFPKNKK